MGRRVSSDPHVWCPSCACHHHPDASFCVVRRQHERVQPPPTEEQISEQDRLEADLIAKHNALRENRAKAGWFWDGKQWRPRSRLEREHLEEGA